MTDVATGFLQSVSAFGATRLGRASATSYHDAGSLMASLADGVPNNTKPAFDKLKADIEADVDLVKPIIKAIEAQTKLIAKMATDSIADANTANFTAAEAGRIAVRIGTALLAIDQAVRIIASELSKDAGGNVNEAQREALMGIWNPWVQPFKDIGDGAGKLLDSLGDQVLGVPKATKELGDVLSFDRDKFRLAAKLVATGERDFGVLRLNEAQLEAFLGFARREFVNPSEAQKLELVERDNKWWRADEAVFGVRIFTIIKPGLQSDPLLKKIMPGSSDPQTLKPTAITLDSVDGLSLGDGQGSGNEKLVLPIQFNFPAVEIREVALGIVRNPAREVSGLEITTVIAAKLGDAVGLQVGGAGVTIALDGPPPAAAMFPWAVSPRWPDAIGVRVNAGPVKGGGYIERKTRIYGTGADKKELVEFGGVLQLEILKVGVFAIGILSPDPFSLVLVMGVRFPTAIELSFGFTFNGVGGILAINRTVDSGELIKGMQSHFVDRVLFPDDPVAEAPKILDQVAKVFPPREGGFVVGPIVELGWGSQAKIVEAKIGLVLSLPDPKIILLGAVRVRAPSKLTPVTDFRCEVYGEITADRLLLIASLRDSKIAGIAISGDLGLLIQWGGGGDFALSVGGFHPAYTPPDALKSLERLTMDLSPPAVVKIIIKAYFAVTAGAVMAGVRGDLNADVGVASAHAWLQLDMIFRWVPRFGFAINLEFGIDIEVFGCSFASISFKGSLEGTAPWKIEGTATVDVWFLPTFHLHLGPYEWGDPPPPIAASASPLSLVAEALTEEEAWKAVMPLDGDMLVALARAQDVVGLIAHPLAALEITQSRLPLETHVDRIGSAGVTAHRVTMGLATTSAGPAGAVSTVNAPFSPGQFLKLEGEALLARSGFDDLPSGCRVGAATTPVSGTAVHADVHWHTFFREEDTPSVDMTFDPHMFNDILVDQSLVGRLVAERENPYMSRVQQVSPDPGATVTVLSRGAATVRQVDDGGAVLADLGVLTATEASRVATTVNATGAGELAAVAVGAM
ncbi:MAG TPA: DUF6603 domain-containing protein [Baekduia sp.]|nr:DUF6603 domain-containing protein [Baekduia sp.]